MKTTVNGVQITYDDQGQGTAIILIHGYPLNKSMWAAQVNALAPQYRVITIDLRGHGESDGPEGTYDMDLLADDVHGIQEFLGIDRAIIAGFSMGGYVAFAYYRKYAESVQALILADTRPQPDSDEARQGRETTAQAVLTDGPEGPSRGFTNRAIADAENNPNLVEKVVGIATSTSVNGFVGDLRGMGARPDSIPTLKEITCPTLIIVGGQDVITPPADSELMGSQIKNARVETIPNAGHLTPMEQPEAFNRIVTDFLSSI